MHSTLTSSSRAARWNQLVATMHYLRCSTLQTQFSSCRPRSAAAEWRPSCSPGGCQLQPSPLHAGVGGRATYGD
eukprot:scaffold14511_cov75-Phaeocystis_antarctica.AAC.1